ncbi:unnamed protein product [Protopolystoma xenopodis]|uniref:Uncharacterized protein n=1 Tax=Protopolystoma xenopodis TaxID=117903 RepID=A0A448X5B1_9PLAT|nr:unnamed protein product [Protopolystoma xenopodis]
MHISARNRRSAELCVTLIAVHRPNVVDTLRSPAELQINQVALTSPVAKGTFHAGRSCKNSTLFPHPPQTVMFSICPFILTFAHPLLLDNSLSIILSGTCDPNQPSIPHSTVNPSIRLFFPAAIATIRPFKHSSTIRPILAAIHTAAIGTCAQFVQLSTHFLDY